MTQTQLHQPNEDLKQRSPSNSGNADGNGNVNVSMLKKELKKFRDDLLGKMRNEMQSIQRKYDSEPQTNNNTHVYEMHNACIEIPPRHNG